MNEEIIKQLELSKEELDKNQIIVGIKTNDDKNVAYSVIEKFDNLKLGKISKIKVVKLLSNNIIVEVINIDNKFYYFLIDMYGLIQEVREQNLYGKVLYKLDDDLEDIK